MSSYRSLIFWGLTCVVSLSCSSGFSAEEIPTEMIPCSQEEMLIETTHTAEVNGQPLPYRAAVGTITLKDDACKPRANLFYISYTKEGVEDRSMRPITFCFNGGPGSSSVWLHLGLLGPQRVALNEEGEALPPYRLVANEYSLLDHTDLVFIDPVSTGYSRAIPPDQARTFHGVEEDIKSIAEFIRIYLTRFHRWESPKFIAGESYGTTRAVGLASYLHENTYLYVNGIILISSVLNFQSIDFSAGNDLAYLLFLPSYTAAAWYHHCLTPDLQQQPLEAVIQQVQEFVNEYACALFKGDRLSAHERKALIEKLARFTSLSPTYIDQSNLRIDMLRFAKEVLRHDKRTIGRFDSRFKGIDAQAVGEHFEYDPSADAIFGAFTATLNHYLHQELKWKGEAPYHILADVRPWDYGRAKNQYLNVAENLRSVMTRNPHVRVFVANGYYDLATPFFATEYTFDHLGLTPALRRHVTMKTYDAGHMMYIYRPALIQLKEDLSRFYQDTLHGRKGRGLADEWQRNA